MKTRCLKCGENHRTVECSIKEKIENPLCINCNTNGHMASSTECPLFPKPRNGTGKTAAENRKRNENNKNSLIITGLSFAQALNPNKSQQTATRGNASSASNQSKETTPTKKNDKNKNFNKETVNNNQNESNEFGFLQAIMEIQSIFNLFPSLLSEMKKSFNYTNPADKLNCLLKGVCSSLSTLSVNDG
ncbi:hypothetical protein TNCV_4817441 [Trichonephila clavipes]|nr:hypothetical protein TNCV_4817441 [Trichonephila clavipes]